MSKLVASGLIFRKLDHGPFSAEILLVCEKNDEKFNEFAEWRWTFPRGKCCDKKRVMKNCCQETSEATIIKEVKEETGYDASISELIESMEKEADGTREKFKHDFYLLNIVGGKELQNYTPTGKTSPSWFKLTALPRNLPPSNVKVLRNFVSKIFLKNSSRK